MCATPLFCRYGLAQDQGYLSVWATRVYCVHSSPSMELGGQQRWRPSCTRTSLRPDSNRWAEPSNLRWLARPQHCSISSNSHPITFSLCTRARSSEPCGDINVEPSPSLRKASSANCHRFVGPRNENYLGEPAWREFHSAIHTPLTKKSIQGFTRSSGVTSFPTLRTRLPKLLTQLEDWWCASLGRCALPW